MSPELTLLIVNVVFLGFAYLWAYPSLPKKTVKAVMIRDLAISFAILIVAAGLYAGRGVAFSLIFFETNWLVFTLLVMFALETPLFLWFAQKHGMSLDEWDDE